MFLKDEPTSKRYRETLGQYLEQIPVEMTTVLDLVQDEPEVAANAKMLQHVLQLGTAEMQTERAVYISGRDDALHIISSIDLLIPPVS